MVASLGDKVLWNRKNFYPYVYQSIHPSPFPPVCLSICSKGSESQQEGSEGKLEGSEG